MDKTRIHHYTPETKGLSAKWTADGRSHPKRPKTQQWAGKVMASVFWNAHSILFIDYLEKGKTINSDYYMALLDRLNAPGSYWFFADLKKMLQGKRFGFNEEVIAGSETHFENKDESFYKKSHGRIREALNLYCNLIINR